MFIFIQYALPANNINNESLYIFIIFFLFRNVKEFQNNIGHICQNNIIDHYCSILKSIKTVVNNTGKINNKFKEFTDINKF